VGKASFLQMYEGKEPNSAFFSISRLLLFLIEIRSKRKVLFLSRIYLSLKNEEAKNIQYVIDCVKYDSCHIEPTV
jgi:hypothetical protein